jgi:serine/threonine-protein kinase
VASNALVRVEHPDLCCCEKPQAKKVATYLKQNESDAVLLEVSSVGLSPESFPLERYTPIALLGSSARATTILARDKQRGTKVALKCFKRIAPAMQPTFQSEVKKNQQLSHTSIAKISDSGFHNGKAPYLVTEYKDGFNLEQCLALYGTPSSDVAVKILMSVCESLIYAQKQGVLHRDIKPGNIIFFDDMNAEPSVLITDFALPKVKASEELTEPRDAVYMSADEARNVEYNEKSEIYSIGNVGFSLLTGRPPFRDGDLLEIKNMHALKLPPKISDLKFDNKRPKDLEEIVERCLEKDPNYRFESVAKLLERLEVFPRRVQMRIAAVLAARKKKKILLTVVAVLVLVILCVLGYIAFSTHR